MKKQIGNLTVALISVATFFLTSCGDDPTLTPNKDFEDPNNVTPGTVQGSSFCYAFSASMASYDTLAADTPITRINSDNFYEVDLGFEFDFCDKSFSKLYIDSDFFFATFTYTVSGGVTDFRNYEISPAGDIDLVVTYDSSSNVLSKLVSTTTGAAGSKVTTIEYRDFAFENFDTGEEYPLNFKIIFSEADNSVAYHYGPQNVTVDFTKELFNQLIIGLYSTNPQDGLFLEGSTSAPSITNNGINAEIDEWPTAGTVYTFTKY